MRKSAEDLPQFGIFAKYWQPGKVKTRLAVTVGDSLAARFHLASLRVLLSEFGQIPFRRVLAYSPTDRLDQFRQLVDPRWNLTAQAPGDLGRRMSEYFQAAIASGHERVLLIGSDSPHLRTRIVHEALAKLRDVPVVLGPSEDGGYYLVGGRADMPRIFDDIEWGTSSVFAQTVNRLSRSQWSQLETSFDVDRIADVDRLRSVLRDQRSVRQEVSELIQICDECLARA